MSSTVQARLGLDFDPVAGTPLYIVYLNDMTAAQPADRVDQGYTAAALDGVRLDALLEFMAEMLPARYEEARALLRSTPEGRIYVGDATVDAETGTIVLAHIYPQFHIESPTQPDETRLVTDDEV